jgi:Tfp pilus assembly protein FimT
MKKGTKSMTLTELFLLIAIAGLVTGFVLGDEYGRTY